MNKEKQMAKANAKDANEASIENFENAKPTTDVGYGYYSKLLKRPFDSLEELQEAELAYHKANDEKLKLVAVKKERADEVKAAYENYLKVKKEAAEMVAKAENEWLKLRSQFAKDYNGYHMTYTNIDGKEEVTFGDLLDLMFRW